MARRKHSDTVPSKRPLRICSTFIPWPMPSSTEVSSGKDYLKSPSPPNLKPLLSPPSPQSLNGTFPTLPMMHSSKEGSASVFPSFYSHQRRFLSLSQQQLQSATLIEDPSFVEDFLRKYPQHEGLLLHLPSGRSIRPPYQCMPSLKFDLFGVLRVVVSSDLFLSLEVGPTTSRHIMETLETISGGRAFELTPKSPHREKEDQNLLWFSCSSFHPLVKWVAHALEQTILQYYFNPRPRFNRIKELKQYVLESNSNLKCLQNLSVPLSQVCEGFLEERADLTECLKVCQQAMRQRIHEQILDLVVSDKKKKKRKRGRKQKVLNNDTEEPDQGQRQLEQKQLVGKENSLQNERIDCQEEIDQKQQNIENQSINCIDNCSTFQQTCFTGPTSFVDLNSQTIEIDLTEETNDFLEEAQIINEQSEQIVIEDNYEEKVKFKRNSSHQLFGCNRSEGQESASVKKKKKKRNGQKQQKNAEEFKSRIVSTIMNRQLNSMLDNLSLQSNSCYDSKVIAFERIRHFSKSLYPQSEAVLFGSNAVGLSLPSSDIDIMLIDLPCGSKDDICECLAQIAIYVNAMGWVTSCSTFFNAKVPLVKLEIDTSVGYYTPKGRNGYFVPPEHYFAPNLDLKDSSKGTTIKVDISISTDGKTSSSTQLMRSWLETNSSLQRVLLALKYNLSLRGFSENFKGGIGSYCLFVMVASYYVQFKQQRQGQDCQILLDILKFYGEDFENQLKIITLGQDECFKTNEEAQSIYGLSEQTLFNNLLKIIDPLNGKLMSGGCFQFNCIKAQWRRIRKQILSLQEMVQSELQGVYPSVVQMPKILANKKSMQRWATKIQNRIDFSIPNILKQQF